MYIVALQHGNYSALFLVQILPCFLSLESQIDVLIKYNFSPHTLN